MVINFGYVRVNTNEQNSDRQLEGITPYVTNEKYIYSDKASGKDMERDGFQVTLKAMKNGDTLYIKSIDRLGRNKAKIRKYLEQFRNEVEIKKKKAQLLQQIDGWFVNQYYVFESNTI
ncbi:recombinase family protein [Priestia megaterium]|uniref:recombinase family protein n=1 Tax=Priestia megaterium TaxID=1404 RepID=UPI002D7E7925|nr:recombinase family protein [Priestia megaterium]MEB4872112.1 recombinase family protein [Priestia megaterium]